MKNSPLRIAIIGGAFDSAVGRVHVSALRMDGKFKVVAGCFSRSHEKNLRTAEEYGLNDITLFQSFKDLITGCAFGKPAIDVVLILTPTPGHFEMVRACLEVGLPVICEKAMVTNPAQAMELNRLANDKNGFLVVTYNYTGYPMVRELAHRIASGELGKVLSFQVEMPQETFLRLGPNGQVPSPQGWRLEDGEIPTIHLDLGVHLHQMVHYLTGEKPLSVFSDQRSLGAFKSIVDDVHSIARYSGDIVGSFWFSKTALGNRNGLRVKVFGSKGSGEWFQARPEELVLSMENGSRLIVDRASPGVMVASSPSYSRFKAGHPAGYLEAFANLYGDIAVALSQFKTKGTWESSEVFGSHLAHEGLEFLQAMVRSAQSGHWESVGS